MGWETLSADQIKVALSLQLGAVGLAAVISREVISCVGRMDESIVRTSETVNESFSNVPHTLRHHSVMRMVDSHCHRFYIIAQHQRQPFPADRASHSRKLKSVLLVRGSPDVTRRTDAGEYPAMKISALKGVPLLASLQETELEAIAAVSTIKHVLENVAILHVDEEGDTLFIILNGRVSVTKHNDEGREVILSILSDGEFFGEMSLLDGKPRSATVIATEPTELLLLRRSDFLLCLSRYPQIATKLLSALAYRLRRTNRQVESLALLNAYGRVAGVLLQLAEDNGESAGNDNRITILERPILQEIANMAGTTRETVSRVINNLEKRGYLERDGRRITIVDQDQLHDDFFFHL